MTLEQAGALGDGGLGTPCACCCCTLACKALRAWGCIGPRTKNDAGCIPRALPEIVGMVPHSSSGTSLVRRLGQVAEEGDAHHHGGQTDGGCRPHPASGRGVRRCDAAMGSGAQTAEVLLP